MQITEKRLTDIKPYEKNPRHNDDAVQYVANSIKEFGFKVPIVIDKNGTIVAGHTRWKAAQQLGMETVPCIVADDLTEQQIKAFRLADNKVSELATWDVDMLSEELDELLGEFSMDDFGFELDVTGDDELFGDNPYSTEVKIPQYEPTGEHIDLDRCFDTSKTDYLIDSIEAANIPDDVKEFLKLAAHRHTVFNYKNIAEYYANADKTVQELMEQSALVIIDIKDAIANGYVKLSKTIEDLLNDETDEE